MKKKLSKSNLLIAQKGISLIAVFAMLIVSIVAIIPLSFGWFAKNNQVSANGMHTQAYKTKFEVTYAIVGKKGPIGVDNVKDIFSEISAPGDSTEVQITIKNKGKYPVKITQFGLEAPNANQDIPKIDSAGNMRYLSTEIFTQLLSVQVATPGKDETTYTNYTVKDHDTEDKEISSEPRYLRGTTASGKLGVDEEASRNPGTAERIDYVQYVKDEEIIIVPSNSSVTFTIRLSFVNAPYDQNIYKDFVNTKGKCERGIFFTYEDQIN
jgi:hypothetical protein